MARRNLVRLEVPKQLLADCQVLGLDAVSVLRGFVADLVAAAPAKLHAATGRGQIDDCIRAAEYVKYRWLRKRKKAMVQGRSFCMRPHVLSFE